MGTSRPESGAPRRLATTHCDIIVLRRRSAMRMLAVLFLGVTVICAADRCSPPPELAEFVSTLAADNPERRAAIEERLQHTPRDVTPPPIFLRSSFSQRQPHP